MLIPISHLLLYIIFTLIVLILSYPLWLYLFKTNIYKTNQHNKVDEVSLIFLSYNGGKSIEEKLSLIIKNLRCYRNWELIIIDNSSEHETRSILSQFSTIENVTILYQEKNIGVANAMNLGVKTSRYKYLLFSDQRQLLQEVNFDNLLSPLIHNDIGAVSARISSYDKEGNYSFIRAYENFIKTQESKIGSVIGVYGPLFSLKKEFYTELPGKVILDDLYLSLNVLCKKKILFAQDVVITDDNFNWLYNKRRANSYFLGLLELLKEPALIKNLPPTTRILLLWHKYFRLFIPILLLISLAIAVFTFSIGNSEYLILFILLSPFLLSKKLRFNILTVFSINAHYFKAGFMKYVRVDIKKQ